MTLKLDSTITEGEFKDKTVKEVLECGKKNIFSLIKTGLLFDDEVLSLAGIKKNIRDVKVTQICADHEKDTRVYQKETASLTKILKEIRTIDNIEETIVNNAETDEGIENSNDYDE